ncbi:MAG: signal peptide peptidase SppA [Candidatus Cloacimonetes bacterium]|nr:signal peptide peptidase SppA [Candidatus Cloacimonadota bacterium]
MKKGLFLICILMLGSILLAQAEHLRYLPVAETDDFWSPLLNPAAMGFENSNGLAFVGEDRDGEYTKNYYTLFFNMENLSYVFERDGREAYANDHHTLALGESIFSPNFYIGAKYDWKNKYFNDGKWGIGGLWRPVNYLSMAATAYDLANDDKDYRLGMSVRPFAYDEKLSRKLCISADMMYEASEEDAEYDWQKPVVSVSTEPVAGLFLSGSYDLEMERIGANISVSLPHTRLGNIFSFNEDDKYETGKMYVHFTDYNQESIFNPASTDRFYTWELKGQITEQKSGYKIGPFSISDKKQLTMFSILEKIEKLKNDDHIKGIYFKNPSYTCSFAARQELQAALLDFKSAGKKIIYYAENMSGSEYCLAASVADAIYLHRNGTIDLRGVSVSMPYFKTLLDTIGIEITNFQSHEYKTAFNSLSYDHMTDAERETYDLLLDGIYTDMIAMIASGRIDKLKLPVKELIDNGPYLNADRAYDEGMIDYLVYEDELDDLIKDEFSIKKFSKSVPEESLQVNWTEESEEKIAVIYAVGSINMGKGKPGMIIGSKTTSDAIRKAREDKSVKGIILRVDSGGGSAFASDVINREIELCKEGKNKKPVIASMAGAAASGGYYISCNADMIMAQSSTITGSIGVIGMWPSFERLYQKIYINWSTVKKGENADFGNTSRSPKKSEIDLVKNFIDKTYNDFIIKVAQGRNMSKEDIHKIAMGRVWTGKQALERGLVDKLGGLTEAVEEMKLLAGITCDVELVDYSSDDSKLGITIDTSNLTLSPVSAELPAEMQTLLTWWDYYQQFKDEKAAMINPVQINE